MKAKELDALESALAKAEADAQKHIESEDGGTSNFDTLLIKVKATESQMKQLDWVIHQIGKRQPDGTRYFVVWLNLSGQGNRRTRMAEAACESMKAQGYDASVYYEMD